MGTFFDALQLTIACPVCGERTIEKAARLRAEPVISCPNCGAVEITGQGLQRLAAVLRGLQSIGRGNDGKA
ncbi:MAG TPA: hypothetical protein VM164_08820 [Burkholderiales bacterium]|nr:hypothetical protein [Burkholderiales bacterium]